MTTDAIARRAHLEHVFTDHADAVRRYAVLRVGDATPPTMSSPRRSWWRGAVSTTYPTTLSPGCSGLPQGVREPAAWPRPQDELGHPARGRCGHPERADRPGGRTATGHRGAERTRSPGSGSAARLGLVRPHRGTGGARARLHQDRVLGTATSSAPAPRPTAGGTPKHVRPGPLREGGAVNDQELKERLADLRPDDTGWAGSARGRAILDRVLQDGARQQPTHPGIRRPAALGACVVLGAGTVTAVSYYSRLVSRPGRTGAFRGSSPRSRWSRSPTSSSSTR